MEVDSSIQTGAEKLNENRQPDDATKGDLPNRKKRSPIWKHFTTKYVETEKGPEEYAHCNYCDRKYKVAGASSCSTGNLNEHIKKKHPDLVSNPKPAEKFEFDQEKFRAALLKWVVVCDQPFTETQEEAFIDMINSLNPDAKVISPTTLKRDLVSTFAVKLEEAKARMNAAPGKISFTMDGWTSKNVLSFVSIRSHFINADWKYESVLLDFVHVDGSHSGLNMCNIFLDCLRRFDIPLSKVMGITMDNVSSNDTFMEHLEAKGIEVMTNVSAANNRVRCLTHILNLSVQDILDSLKVSLNYEDADEEESEFVEDLDDELEEENWDGGSDTEDEDVDEIDETYSNKPTIVKLRKLVLTIRRSTQKRQKLRKLCVLHGMSYLTPKIDVKTRWNSTYEMLERAAMLKVPIRALCGSEKSLRPFIMHKNEWAELNLLSVLLQKFDRATKLLSMERHPTITAYLPTFHWLLDALHSFINDNPGPLANAAENGLEKLQKYEEELQLNKSKIPYFAVILNPASKMTFFKEHKFRNIREIQKAFSDYFEKEYDALVGNTECNELEDPDDELYAFMYKRPKVTKATKEIQKYFQYPLSSFKINILEFWQSHQHDFPVLSKMARDVLPVQGASVAVERDFSDAADIVTVNRCSLDKETIRKLMCLKDWYSF